MPEDATALQAGGAQARLHVGRQDPPTWAAPKQRPDPPRIEGGVLKLSWPVTPNQDARSIAQGLAVLAASYASEVPDAVSMQASLQFILDGGGLYQGGFASVSLASMRTNSMYAETIEDNLVMQVHQLLARKAAVESDL